ncbi:MAG: 4Fe-4S dicluster domain-containing protein [Bacteroidales bacterium]|nr:MAG: 4Fe-4S dicluster domain-containing protein [Bacteroidales bacterium]
MKAFSNKKNKRRYSPRRKFLKSGLVLSAAFISGSTSISSCSGDNSTKSGKKTRLLTQDGNLVEVDESNIHESHKHCIKASLKEERKGIPGRKFVMVIDLAKCRNARKCIEKCQEAHNLPPDQEWMKVYLIKDSQHTEPYWFPKPCFHCDNPPCVKVCPVDATFKRKDGIVLIDNHRCIGCKFCLTGCPYSARIYNWKEPEIPEDIKNQQYSAETSVPAMIGTVSKCDFCPDMCRIGKVPHCVSACPNGAIYYGDLNEDAVSNGNEVVRFSELMSDKGGYRYAEELGTEPCVYYLPPKERIFPVKSGFKNLSEEEKARYKNIIK